MNDAGSTAIEKSAMEPIESLFSWFREMHDQNPVHYDDEYGLQLFRHADISKVLTDPATYSSETVSLFNDPQPDLDLFLAGNLVTSDPPHHKRLRQAISRSFTPRAVGKLHDKIRRTVDALLDDIPGSGRFDLIETVAYPLPIIVVTEMLGFPREDVHMYRAWGDALGALDAATVPPDVMEAEVVPAIQEMNAYILGHIRERRKDPADDLLTELALATMDGEMLEDGHLIGLVGLTLFAGHAASMALLGNSVLTFSRYPEPLAEVRANRELIPGAAEELMRLYPPFSRMARVTTTETKVGGQRIGKGELVTLWTGAANRDPEQFSEPDEFDIHRKPGGHIAFGQGIHFCLGAPLARLEIKVALNALFDRFNDVEIDYESGVQFENPMQIICPRRLPVRVSG
ncbi:cytochrome P450 [Nocardiopsis rhodophaea]|uniref:cytochrome P450 n=1 Tax=Nocardiopsis rhodophaea TaxID=280238 RepID=UPI0031D52149